jgi:hypothetical protein
VLFSTLALLPKLVSFVALFTDIKPVFWRVLVSILVPLVLLMAPSSIIAAMINCLHWLGVDVHYHPRAFVAIVSAFELLKDQG